MTAPRQARHWAQVQENTWVGGILFLLAVHRWLGRWPFRVAVFPVVCINWLLRPSLRRASLGYLSRIEAARGAAPPPPSMSLRHVMRFADTVLDKLLAAGGRYPLGRVRVEGREALAGVVASGRGAVIVTAHVGCLELCQYMAQEAGAVVLNILVHTRHAEKFNALLRRLNPGATARFMEVTDFGPALAMRLAACVAAGELVVIAGDRVPVSGQAMVEAPLLGAPANFPMGPYMLAGACECPLFFLCCIREGAGYLIHFEQLASGIVLSRPGRAARLAQYAASYAQALQGMLLRSPLDWFNFFDFWSQGRDQAPRA